MVSSQQAKEYISKSLTMTIAVHCVTALKKTESTCSNANVMLSAIKQWRTQFVETMRNREQWLETSPHLTCLMAEQLISCSMTLPINWKELKRFNGN
jgi:hypothetical protein